MKLLIIEQQESYENAKICYICNEKFENIYVKVKEYRKVRDHCRYTGEFVMESPEETNFGKSPGKSLKSYGKIIGLCQFRQLMQVSLQNKGMINFFYHCIVTVLFYGGPSSHCVNYFIILLLSVYLLIVCLFLQVYEYMYSLQIFFCFLDIFDSVVSF